MVHLLTPITTNAHYASMGIKGYQVINALKDIPETYSSELSPGKKAVRIAFDLMFVCGQVAIAALPKKPLTPYLEYGVAALSIATNFTDWACQNKRTSNNLLKNVGLIVFRLADITHYIKLPEGLFPTAARSLVCWGTVLTTLYAERTRIAAYLGSAKAQYKLGNWYYYGKGFVESNVKASNWYRKAAQKGHLKSQIGLARLYKTGQGVPQDYHQAIKWYTKAANQNSPMAQTELGQLYREIENYDEAVQWFRKAANANDDTAQCCLGEMYRDGLGVVQSDTEAFKLFKKAADNLNSTAKIHLALCYYLGKGVEQDFDQPFPLEKFQHIDF